MSIKIQNISKYYDEQLALNNVSFQVNSGEIVGFLGPNGAGKSTTMKIISCFIKPSEGDVFVDEISIHSDEIAVKSKIGYLPENNPLYEDLYVRESIGFIAQMHKIKDIKSAVENVIEKVGLSKEAHKKIGQLSKGYQQRVGIAQAIVHNPKVLILDEPTSGLDPNQLDEIRSLIKDLGKNKTVMLSTHIMQEVESICDRIVVINNGKIVADRKLDDNNETKREQKEQKLLVEFEQKITLSELKKSFSKASIKSKENQWVFTYDGKEDLRRLISRYAQKNDLLILEMQQHSDNLEDLFKKLTK
ncbi:ATP-binding cassette domain-containing protein [bacterium]|jgi:ABC-2 type transport system ATP-binding protein|nr:ATP-binding cassette domain-containing protein [bacterium]